MTSAAGSRQIQRVYLRVRVFSSKDIVASVAVTAGGGVPVTLRRGLSVNALGVGLECVRMAGGALNRLELSRMGNLGGIAVAGGASQRRVDGTGKLLPLNMKRNAFPLPQLLKPGRPVAGKTNFFGTRLSLRKAWREKNGNNENGRK